MNRLLRKILLMGAVAAAASHHAAATPSQELAHAAGANGSAESRNATATRFVAGFTSVFARLKRHETATYLVTALKLRAELTEQIVVAALRMQLMKYRADDKTLRAEVTRLIEASVAADHLRAAAIVAAAISASPSLADLIVAAAIKAAPEQKQAILESLAQSGMYAGLSRSVDSSGDFLFNQPAALNPPPNHRKHHVVSPEKADGDGD